MRSDARWDSNNVRSPERRFQDPFPQASGRVYFRQEIRCCDSLGMINQFTELALSRFRSCPIDEAVGTVAIWSWGGKMKTSAVVTHDIPLFFASCNFWRKFRDAHHRSQAVACGLRVLMSRTCRIIPYFIMTIWCVLSGTRTVLCRLPAKGWYFVNWCPRDRWWSKCFNGLVGISPQCIWDLQGGKMLEPWALGLSCKHNRTNDARYVLNLFVMKNVGLDVIEGLGLKCPWLKGTCWSGRARLFRQPVRFRKVPWAVSAPEFRELLNCDG